MAEEFVTKGGRPLAGVEFVPANLKGKTVEIPIGRVASSDKYKNTICVAGGEFKKQLGHTVQYSTPQGDVLIDEKVLKEYASRHPKLPS